MGNGQWASATLNYISSEFPVFYLLFNMGDTMSLWRWFQLPGHRHRHMLTHIVVLNIFSCPRHTHMRCIKCWMCALEAAKYFTLEVAGIFRVLSICEIIIGNECVNCEWTMKFKKRFPRGERMQAELCSKMYDVLRVSIHNFVGTFCLFLSSSLICSSVSSSCSVSESHRSIFISNSHSEQQHNDQ